MVDILLDKPRSVAVYTGRWMERWGADIENGLLRKLALEQ